MEKEIIRKTLIHESPSMHLHSFLQEVINTGGWPYDYMYVSFYHSVENNGRYCKFTNEYLRTGYWTTICHMDEFLEFLMSGDKIFEIEKRGIDRLLKRINLLPIEE